MRILTGSAAAATVNRLSQRSAVFSGLEPRVRRIIDSVRREGDRALRRYAEKWDGLGDRQPFRVSEEEMARALEEISPKMRRSLQQAMANIRHFSETQKLRSWNRTRAGITLGQVVRPLGAVGCYVPGGRHPLVSTLLMTVIPAQTANVKNIRVVSPKPSRALLAGAAMLQVHEFYRIGGAQAIAALAYGTRSVARVDKIVGPGNAYVTAAKKLVAFDCAIDFLAGPTEALLMSDSGNADFIASDLVAQAEHDPDTLSVFITTSQPLARSVSKSVARFVEGNSIATESLRRRGAILVATSHDEAREWANRLAPEHITVEEEDLPFIENAGSIFVGDFSAQAAGDYASGPNHV